VQALDTQISEGKARRSFVVILSPVVDIPAELARQMIVIEHELPGRDQLEQIAHGIASEPGDLPEGPQLAALIDASCGLTRMEAEGAYSLSLVRHGRIRAEEVWDLKAQALNKSGLMALHRGDERFAELGGLDAMKAFCARSLRPNGSRTARPRGILLLGVPGTGKSAFAKALGNETGRPTLTLDIGALMGSLVGQTEHNVREALRIADAMAPAILFVDEIEKGLSGVAASGNTDSGVSARLFGTLLTWMNDHSSDVFLIATCNDASKLPPEFTRAERFDALYFLDFPTPEQKDTIWRLHIAAYGIEHDQPRPKDTDWTGAEIKACCRLAALLDVPLLDAARNVVPISATASENVQRLRAWAAGRCLSADRPGLYQQQNPKVKTARRIERPADPESN
jgi:predicted kinase